ncbi:bifunctional diguanylate cyclase/phosphodiesterase [Pseudorhodoferax sp. Leaf267]|uniref:putative bifunctional diguanylate cyclase/phosphodiesterase n=1 Tax=Pseudorhodoferax sp. Leaf267 TaxID=1736316 RepID=UPI0006FDC7B9|nr:EAL domain-containing protein [Pseudorhodoferax sp. Leaf267]KQP22002.1 hypothetical protein ASF43_24445 [Pseudorhodoferax sp. Leaf267]
MNSHAIPKVYLRKWRSTVQTLAALREGQVATLAGLDAQGQLVVLLAEGGGESGRVLGLDAHEWDAVRSRAPLASAEGEGSCCVVSVLWPDQSLYGVLSVRNAAADAFDAPWQQLMQQMRLFIESDLRTIHYVRLVEQHKEQLEGDIQQRNRELLQVNERLAGELDKTRRLGDVMRTLTTSGDGGYGETYFRNLVQQLAQLFGGDHALVSVVSPDKPGHAVTLAAYSDGRWRAGFSYPLQDGPCLNLLGRRHVLVPQGLGRRYPRARLPRLLPADSYVGVQLCDARGGAIGMLVVMGRGELPDSQLALQFMELMATRTSTEIQRMRAEQHLRRLSEEDQLTGLLSRGAFLERLHGAVAQAAASAGSLAVLFIDMDNFKTVNDSLGHDLGDALLVQAGQRIQMCFRGSDIVARLGGDEFAALVVAADEAQLAALCARIVQRFGDAFFCEGHELFVSVSIGVSQYPGHGQDAQALLRMADVAMYQAKDKGKNQVQFYTTLLKDKVQHDLHMGTRLRHALIEKQLLVFYQPQVDTRSRLIVGAEALLRWQDEEQGPVPPTEFIALAQRTGNIEALGELVTSVVAGHLRAWRDAGLAVPPIAVNVSPSQLRCASFASGLERMLRAHALSPSMLTIELTEDALMRSGDAGMGPLDELAQRGFRLSIDDFGTGYSSLSYLRSMPIREVKIDRSFIHGIAQRNDDRAIAAAILSLAGTLELDVVAEGVEDESQLMVLDALGCRVAQGYLFHQPMPEAQFRALLAAPVRAAAPAP